MKVTFWTCLLTAALVGPVNADVLEMPEPTQAAPESTVPETQAFTITLPGRGMTKDQVEERFGTPPEKVGAIGEPPISRWVYSGFTVYFEYDHVIHSVNHR